MAGVTFAGMNAVTEPWRDRPFIIPEPVSFMLALNASLDILRLPPCSTKSPVSHLLLQFPSRKVESNDLQWLLVL